MIVSYRGKWTRDFAAGKRVKAFYGFERSARLKLDRLEAATTLARVTQILNGTRAITGDTALRLGHFFGTSAQFWLNLQSLYEIRIAEARSGKSIKGLPKLKRRELMHA